MSLLNFDELLLNKSFSEALNKIPEQEKEKVTKEIKDLIEQFNGKILIPLSITLKNS